MGGVIALGVAIVQINGWLALGCVLFLLLSSTLKHFNSYDRLFLARSVFIASLIIVPLGFLFPDAALFFASDPKDAALLNTPHNLPAFQSLPFQESVGLVSPLPIALDHFYVFSLGLILCGILYNFFLRARVFFELRKLKTKSHLIRSLGAVRVYLADVDTAFSLRSLRHCYIWIPKDFLFREHFFQIALRHEIQHHRQGDTAWLWSLNLLKAFFIWNPFYHLWERTFQSLHEFACDEMLLKKKSISPQQYGSCLLEAAQSTLLSRSSHQLKVRLTMGNAGQLLKRRIVKMLESKTTTSHPKTLAVLAMLITICVITVAYATSSNLQDRRVTAREATLWLENAKRQTQFPLSLNEMVLEKLQNFLGSEESRAKLRKAIERMEEYRAVIEPRMEAYGHPKDLLAIPLIESGFKKHGSPGQRKSAGLWQFIRNTAKNYNLTVSKEKDDRFDETLDTDAAMRYLGALHLRFQDWRLAVLAYNAGENKVQTGIDRTGSRDPYVLIEEGFGGDEGYLAKFTAAALILRNPTVIQ